MSEETKQSAEKAQPEEAYCVDSGRPVGPLGGDRCKSHGAALTPCYVAFRAPRCEHPDWPRWANGSDRCPECRAVANPPGGDSDA